jgi:DNA-binding LacI/PurR family transcriptional regulator
MAQLGRALVRKVVTRGNRPTGILAMNDMMAIGLVLGLQAQGLRVPDDVSVIGIDDMFLAGIIEPGITTIRLPLQAMARTMVDRIVHRLQYRQSPTEQFTFPPHLVVRGSVATVGPPVRMGRVPGRGVEA